MRTVEHEEHGSVRGNGSAGSATTIGARQTGQAM
jgi:hypothetical protein